MDVLECGRDLRASTRFFKKSMTLFQKKRSKNITALFEKSVAKTLLRFF
jgi:hypothetical protein